jgi:uncharacterized protein YjeT (DUF2065 family)
VASCLILACGCLGVAIARLPRERLRRFGRAAPTVGVLTLVTLVFVALFSSGLTALLGSFTNVAVAALFIVGGCVWVVGRVVRRHGTASIAAVGATVLAAAAWLAVDDAWQSRPTAMPSTRRVSVCPWPLTRDLRSRPPSPSRPCRLTLIGGRELVDLLAGQGLQGHLGRTSEGGNRISTD